MSITLNDIEKLVAEQGIVGLQTLEYQGLLKRNNKRHAKSTAKGISVHRLSDILQMIDWLRDGDYLIDYGILMVWLAKQGRISDMEYFNTCEEYEILNSHFILDYKNLLSHEVITWLKNDIASRPGLVETCIYRTKYGYSFVDEEDVVDPVDYSGLHYSRYAGFYCVD